MIREIPWFDRNPKGAGWLSRQPKGASPLLPGQLVRVSGHLYRYTLEGQEHTLSPVDEKEASTK